jgi:hypothetical protein
MKAHEWNVPERSKSQYRMRKEESAEVPYQLQCSLSRFQSFSPKHQAMDKAVSLPETLLITISGISQGLTIYKTRQEVSSAHGLGRAKE